MVATVRLVKCKNTKEFSQFPNSVYNINTVKRKDGKCRVQHRHKQKENMRELPGRLCGVSDKKTLLHGIQQIFHTEITNK
jgi:hypothetical protein